nr:hypothetical protein CFP56_64492 [Quercus suber]
MHTQLCPSGQPNRWTQPTPCPQPTFSSLSSSAPPSPRTALHSDSRTFRRSHVGGFRRSGLDDDAHEVGLGGDNGADGLGLGERRGLFGREDWG